ncbi:MAG: hypothetical protein A3E61_00995 [Candidatus Colwellbacteria bacterium RIFCSPHIGHO2_12_FULL_43_12]|uniref:Uncharacterized protein n=3 Tax=Candidatus Colwelliibacteriota TaxID=1817904 RepID=A0A1G1Z1H6_9BACT|nr:MAG: hypothetical protein A3D47_01710 [Candidatus Colwellbacteria bacterium RIFCSPHIGHO2_02_FULL_43_15]OGY58196.1 MAG: hypothetical protein A3E61_00995 [Candidatus Colwellbacteria bacterium RIFCSPHIGHO2_12_FULL_43_12]OGY61937.1 MAG: hypothetical protein A3F99_01375 [Candidatus Colwellbacteria bacterium RIFCSPLOWO2_12_FULL_43_11]
MPKKISKLQRNLIISAVVTLVLVAVSVIYSLGFLSNNLWRTLKLEPANNGGVIEFDIKGFKALNL